MYINQLLDFNVPSAATDNQLIFYPLLQNDMWPKTKMDVSQHVSLSHQKDCPVDLESYVIISKEAKSVEEVLGYWDWFDGPQKNHDCELTYVGKTLQTGRMV